MNMNRKIQMNEHLFKHAQNEFPAKHLDECMDTWNHGCYLDKHLGEHLDEIYDEYI